MAGGIVGLLPFLDRDYHVFSAASLPALTALEQLMERFGHRQRPLARWSFGSTY
jgi:hypothetical protein